MNFVEANPHLVGGSAMTKFVFGKSEEMGAWAAAKLPWAQDAGVFGPYEAWGILKGDALVGVVVFNNYRAEIGDIELNIISPDGHWGSRTLFATIADYVFNQLKCERISVTLPEHAKRNRDAAEKAGFTVEGTRRRGFPGGSDAIMYGLLKEDCRWLEKEAA